MLDLNQIVIDTMTKIAEEKYVEKALETNMKKAIDEVIKDTFGNWSPFSKQLKTEVSEKIKVDLSKLDLAQYQTIIGNTIKAKINEVMAEDLAKRVNEQLDEMLVTAKPEYKLSEIIEQFKKDNIEDARDEEYDEISFHIDPDSRVLQFIYFDEKPGLAKYQCTHRLVLNDDGKINSFEKAGYKTSDKFFIGTLHGIEKTLFVAYSQGSKIIVDKDNINTDYEYDEYEED